MLLLPIDVDVAMLPDPVPSVSAKDAGDRDDLPHVRSLGPFDGQSAFWAYHHSTG